MCGIAGVVTRGPDVEPQEDRLQRAADALRDRGPDASGVWLEPGAGLAATRLAIIDRAHGDQPMLSDDGRYAVVFNGEIYNHHELRRDLERTGCRLRTGCDTEVLPNLYARYGADMVRRLRGMFAFAILDRRERTLFLARDRFGKKPLYMTERGGALAFASTLDALIEVTGLTPRIDPQSLYEYLVLQYVASPRAAFDGVTKLPPGHTAIWNDGVLDVTAYWTPPRRPGRERRRGPFGPAELGDLRQAIADAVVARLESEVPLGIFLSGGIDSSVIVAEAAGAGLRPRTFSVGFTSAAFDETPYATMVADRFGADHQTLVADRHVSDVFSRFSAAYDEPFADASALPTLSVARAASEHVTVVLTGDGGDELFGGYERYRWYRMGARARACLGPLSAASARAGGGVAGAVGWDRAASAAGLLGAPWEWYRDRLFHFPPESALGLLRPELAGSIDEMSPVRRLDTLWDSGGPSPSGLLSVDQATYLPDDLLVKMDRATMAFGLEARSPLLDHTLAGLVSGYPDHWLFSGRNSKAILRAAYRGILPEEVLRRPKMGFGVPIERWMRAELRPHVERLLLSPGSVIWEWLRWDLGSQMVRRFLDGEAVPGRQVWNLLALASWADGRLHQAAPEAFARR